MEIFRARTALCKTHVERAPRNEASCTPKTTFSPLWTHIPPPFNTQEQNLSIPNICSRKTQKLPTVVTFRVHNPIPAKQCSSTAATSLCQLGSLSGGDAPGGTADVCAPAQMGTSPPALASAGVPGLGLLQGGAEPWCPPTILVLHYPSPVPPAGVLLSVSTGHRH